jgi:hypothetical protein
MSSTKKSILGMEFVFVYRYRFQKKDEDRLLDAHTLWREWKLGFFFNRHKIVGKRNFNKPKEWTNNLVNMYTVGVDLLIWKMWVTINKGGMTLELKDKKK